MEPATRILVVNEEGLPPVRAEIHYFHGKDGNTSTFKPVLKVDDPEMRLRLEVDRRTEYPEQPATGGPGDLIRQGKQILAEVRRRLGEAGGTAIPLGLPSATAIPAEIPESDAQDDRSHGAESDSFKPAKESQGQLVLKQDDVIDGVVVAFGSAPRVIDNRNIDHYCVDLLVRELGPKPQRIWGTDLERAIEEARANVGDRVQILCLGYEPVRFVGASAGGKPNIREKRKKLFTICKITEEESYES